MINVLFVCTGNICRSPTAEGVFRQLSARAGLEKHFAIGSAGTDSWHAGEPPDPRAIATAKRHGVDISRQRARAFVAEDYAASDHIYAMDKGHMRQLKARAPARSRARLAMFLAALTGSDADEVDDPWYGDTEDFEEAWRTIHAGAEALLKHLAKEHHL